MGPLALNIDKSIYKQVAELHVTMIPDGFLSSLGVKFLSLLYEAIDKSERNFLDMALNEDGYVIGFVAGGSSYSEVYFYFIRNPYRFICSFKFNVLLLTKIIGVLEVLLKTLGGKKEHENQPAELYSIAVVDSEQRGGVAKGLFENLVDYFALRGYCSFVIRVGVHLSNAHAFYLKQGAVKQSSVKFHGNRSSVVYRYFIEDDAHNKQHH